MSRKSTNAFEWLFFCSVSDVLLIFCVSILEYYLSGFIGPHPPPESRQLFTVWSLTTSAMTYFEKGLKDMSDLSSSPIILSYKEMQIKCLIVNSIRSFLDFRKQVPSNRFRMLDRKEQVRRLPLPLLRHTLCPRLCPSKPALRLLSNNRRYHTTF